MAKKPYKYKKWAVIEQPQGLPLDEIISSHDLRIGAFIRSLAAAEILMKEIMFLLLKQERRLGHFWLSKLSAGQTGDMFKEVVKSKTSGNIQDACLKSMKQFMAINSFRNQIAHGGHIFLKNEPALITHKVGNIGKKSEFISLSEIEMDKKIEILFKIIANLGAVYNCISGEAFDLDDLIKQALQNDDFMIDIAVDAHGF